MVRDNGPRTIAKHPFGTHHAGGEKSPSARTALALFAQAYFLGLFGWLLLYWVAGDARPLLFAVNSFAVYLFAPVPLGLLAAALARRPWAWALWAQSAVAVLVWAFYFGALFVPSLPAAQAAGPRLRVLTANLLGYNQNTPATLAALRAAGADVVALQELNVAAAAAIRRELAGEYPYMLLEPQEGVRGAGIISRYPLRPTGERLAGTWLGEPHIVALEVEGHTVTLIRFHALSGLGRVDEREDAARALASYAAAHTGPLLAAGDLNATGLSGAHDTITRELGDAWEAAGWGLGHTFPGADSPGSSRPSFIGIPVPQWLIRIDYIFYSEHLQPLTAQVGPWDGVSDHRPVLVEVALEQ